MIKNAGWEKVASVETQDDRISERLVLEKSFSRKGRSVPIYLVADAWDGKYINDTIKQFMRYNAGNDVLWVAFTKDKQGWHDLIAKTYVIKNH